MNRRDFGLTALAGSTSKTLAFLVLGTSLSRPARSGASYWLSRLQAFFQRRPKVRKALDRATGCLLAVLGIRLAVDR